MNVQQVMIAAPDGACYGPRLLARAPDFMLGRFAVRPSSRLVAAPDGTSVTLEPLMMQVLVALAEQEGRILTRDDLIAQCWGRRIVGDDAVNRVISRLRRALHGLAGDAVAVETIAKVGYRLKVAEAAEGAATPPARPHFARLTAWKAAGALALFGATTALAGSTWHQPPTVERPVSIAIEPGAGIRDAASARFASDVWTDIARLSGAKTRLSFVDGPAPTRSADIVAHISLARDGRALVSRARLVVASTGAVIWAQNYRDEGGLTESLRQLTAVSMATVMGCGLERAAGELVDPVDMRLYFGACEAAMQDDWARAREFAEEIVARQPHAATGWSCVALTMAREAVQADTPNPATLRRAVRLAEHALSLDPQSPLAYHALVVITQLEGRPALSLLRTAVGAAREDAALQASYATALFEAGYVAAAIAPAQRAVALEPTNTAFRLAAVRRLLSAGRVREALAAQAGIERDWNSLPNVAEQRHLLLPLAPDREVALAKARGARELPPRVQDILVAELEWRIAGERYDRARFDRAAERLFAAHASGAWDVTLVAARMGDHERALSWLAKSPVVGTSPKWALLFRAEAASLRRDPRFFAKMAQLGLVELWRKEGKWPDFCAEKGLRYDCATEARRLPRTDWKSGPPSPEGIMVHWAI